MANPEHLAKLKEGVEVWNMWRIKNPDIKPDLYNAAIYRENGQIQAVEIDSEELRVQINRKISSDKYEGVYLVEIDLTWTNLQQSILQGARLHCANLQRANLSNANLQGAELAKANLQGALLTNANLQGASFNNVNLQGAKLDNANLQGARLWGANLKGAEFDSANLQGANLIFANLQEAILAFANLKGAVFDSAKLQGAEFGYAIVDGETLINSVEVDRDTNFEGVGLDAMRIEPGIKQLLEYNIRRKNWGKWYKEHSLLKFIVNAFWQISDYGLSTKTIIVKFFKWAAIFALLYLYFEYRFQEGIVNSLSQVDGQQVQWWLVPIRAFYFSVVTMTTLGFGDMYAKFSSLLGHLLLIIQVLMGYMFLGALVTRFAVLFTAGGPAAKFTERSEEDKKALEKLSSKQSKNNSS